MSDISRLSSQATNNEKNNILNMYLFFSAYILYIFSQFMLTVNTEIRILGSIKYLILIPLILLVVLNKYSANVVLKNIIFLSITLIVSVVSKTYVDLILIYLIIFCSAFIPFKKIIKIHMYMILILMLAVFVAYNMGILKEISYYTYMKNGDIRNSLGYTYTTFMPNFFLHLIMMYAYVRKKFTILEIIIILLINQYLLVKTQTLAVYYYIILFVVVSYIYINLKLYKIIGNRLKNLILLISALFFTIIPIYLSYIYDINNNLLYELNFILTGRLELGNQGLERYGITLFGNPIEWLVLEKSIILREYFYVDSSSLNMLLNFGVLFSVIIWYLFHRVTKKIIKIEKNQIILIVVIVLYLHSAFDPQFFELRYNPFLLMIGWLINPRWRTY